MASLSAIATAGSAIVTAIAAAGVFLQVKAASQTNAAQLFVSFSERYNSTEMATALRTLAAWRLQTPGDDFARGWVYAKEAGDAKAVTLNEHRRLVSRFYFDIARLHDSGLLSRRHACDLLSNNGVNVFYLVCEPMNLSRHPHRSSHLPRVLSGLITTYGDGQLHGTLPPRPVPAAVPTGP